MKIIEILESDCWLAQPDHSKPFYLYTDYSGVGIGATLMQTNDNGHELPVAMISRSLSDTEQHYAPIEGEALALIWSIDRLKYLIEGQQVVLRTDHKPLIFIF